MKKKKTNYKKISAVIAIINIVLLLILSFTLLPEILLFALISVIPLILYFGKIKNYTWVTILFIAINDLVFLICLGYLMYWFIYAIGHSHCNEIICLNTLGMVSLGLLLNILVFLPYIVLTIDIIKNTKKKKKRKKKKKKRKKKNNRRKK